MKIKEKIINVLWHVNFKLWGFASNRAGKHMKDETGNKFEYWMDICNNCSARSGKLLSQYIRA